MASETGQKAFKEEIDSDAGVNKVMATQFNIEDRIPLLLIHGILHLLGYDHETDQDWCEMTQKEEEVMQLLKVLPSIEPGATETKASKRTSNATSRGKTKQAATIIAKDTAAPTPLTAHIEHCKS